MELVVRKNDLLRELQLFQGIVERKNTIPILANVLLEAKGEEVWLSATDLEVGLRSKCAASIAFMTAPTAFPSHMETCRVRGGRTLKEPSSRMVSDWS